MPLKEKIATNQLMLFAMLLAASYTMMRAAGDSLFLSRVGNDSLAAVFVVSGIITALLATLWYVVTRRFDLTTTIRVSYLLSASLTLIAWLALPYLHHSWVLLGAVYLLTELKGCINSITVVSATNETLGGRSSRIAWARVGIGAPLGGVVVGILIGLEARQFGVETWILLSGILDLVAMFSLSHLSRIRLAKKTPHQQTQRHEPLSPRQGRPPSRIYVSWKKFRFWIGLLIAAKVVVLTFITFIWKTTVNDFYAHDEQAITRYFGVFYAVTGLLTILFQILVTGRLMVKRDLSTPLMVMPIGLSILCAIVACGPGVLVLMIVITLAKSFEVWRRSVHDTTLSFLYTRIVREKRRRAISFNTAIVKPVAEVSASLILLLGSTLFLTSSLIIALVIWCIAAIGLLRLVLSVRKESGKSKAKSSVKLRQKACSGPA